MRKLALLLIPFAFAACTVSKPYLYYGNYSRSYYNVVKKQDEASRAQFKQSLERVFARSAEYSIPVPPGLYCDYALLMLEENRLPDAKRYFELEKSNWAESAMFVDFLIQRYQLGIEEGQ
ncbi:MAG: DUF4810 domain-containing protein [Candidatus Cloacimonadaceae bacterium]|nr:DUF4810 domain-containing protein [Candidatus Cloacimonadaceae bacterium]MDP3114471.1 DUF4810 domain-containing protein [Candidatus Cloacimonadaceae bacterium]